jgi:transcription elongation factor Elf1
MKFDRNFNPRMRRENKNILGSYEPKCTHCGHDSAIVIAKDEECVTLRCKACGNMYEIFYLQETV